MELRIENVVDFIIFMSLNYIIISLEKYLSTFIGLVNKQTLNILLINKIKIILLYLHRRLTYFTWNDTLMPHGSNSASLITLFRPDCTSWLTYISACS